MALAIVVVFLIFAATRGTGQKSNTPQKTTPAGLDRELKAVEDRVDQFEAEALAKLNSKSLDPNETL